MKIIHTADWHLGQTFAEYSRKTEHKRFLSWLIQLIKIQNVDLLLIAGDIFDSSNPPAYAQKMYYNFLHQCTRANPNLQIIITAGNHDSAARLEAPDALLESMNISVRGIIHRKDNNEIDFDHLIIPLKAGGYCMAIPYLRQGEYPKSKTYVEGIQNMYKEVFRRTQEKLQGDANTGKLSNTEGVALDNTPSFALGTASGVAPIIAMGHLLSSGAQFGSAPKPQDTNADMPSQKQNDYEGKRGGLEQVSADSFDTQITYTALGHIHRHQSVGGRTNIRYSGSPLPMSFAEINNKQGVELITIEASPVENSAKNMDTTIERIIYESPVFMKNLTKKAEPKDVILEAINALPDIPTEALLFEETAEETAELSSYSPDLNHDFWPFLKIQVAISEPEPSLKYEIEKALKNKAIRLAQIHASTKEYRLQNSTITYEKLKSIQPIDMALEVFKQHYGGEDMPQDMQACLQDIIDDVNKEQ